MMASLGILSAGCSDEDSTTMTFLGDFNDLSKEVQEISINNAKNYDREDYYGTWYYSEGLGYMASEVTLKIDENYVEDTYSGKKVEYKFNKKTHEIVIDSKGFSELTGEDIYDGRLVYSFAAGSDLNLLYEMGMAIDENGDKTTLLGDPYKRIESDDENSNESFVDGNRSTESSQFIRESTVVEESSTVEDSSEVSNGESTGSDTTNPMIGTWKASDTPLVFEITSEIATVNHGLENYELTNPIINGETVTYDSNFKIGDSATIYKVELELFRADSGMLRLYLEDQRIIEEYLNIQ